MERPEGSDDGRFALRAMTPRTRAPRILKAMAVALGSFGGLGTVSALWDNPFFIRMTPAGSWEIALLAVMSILLGVYVAIRRPICSAKAAGTGGLLGFLGVACPVCNKVLLLLFGGELLLTYFEPVRIYVAAAGVLLIFTMLVREWAAVRKEVALVHARTAPGIGEPLAGDA